LILVLLVKLLKGDRAKIAQSCSDQGKEITVARPIAVNPSM